MKDEKKEVDNSSHKFKNYWKNEGAKLKEMTFGEKISYIVEYYKYYFIAILIVVLLVVGITASIKHNDYNTYVNVYLVDNSISYESTEYLVDDFAKYAGIDGINDRVVVDSTLTFTLERYNEYDTQAVYKFMALIADASIDTIISNKSIVDFCAPSETYLDLSTLLPEDFLNEHKDRLYTVTLEDGSTIVAGIDISGLDIIDKCHITLDEPVISVAANTPHADNAVKLIEFLFE